MTVEEITHINNNLEQINAWIGSNADLLVSDTTKPIFEAYERETGYSVNACNNCKLDALIWARLQVKLEAPDYNFITAVDEALTESFVSNLKTIKTKK